MKCHHHTNETTDAQSVWRAENFDLLISRLNVPLMRSANPSVLLFDYAQPMSLTNWTRTLLGLVTPDQFSSADPDDYTYRLAIKTGIKMRLDEIGADGIFIDTPQETSDSWRAVQLVSEIREAIYPRKLMINTGDADSWMGRTPQWKALTAIADWHMVEVWLDINRYSLLQFTRRAEAANKAIGNGKNLILGVYDEGAKNTSKVGTLMRGLTDKVWWMYKISATDCGLIPGQD